MNTSLEILTYPQLMEQLRRLCDERRTGTFVITTDTNHPARFVLREGRIIEIWYRFTGGADAVAQLRTIEGGRYRFTNEMAVQRTAPLVPPTDEILHMLFDDGRSRPTAPSA